MIYMNGPSIHTGFFKLISDFPAHIFNQSVSELLHRKKMRFTALMAWLYLPEYRIAKYMECFH